MIRRRQSSLTEAPPTNQSANRSIPSTSASITPGRRANARPRRGDDLAVEADVRAQAGAVRDGAVVVEDLLLLGHPPPPARMAMPGERVQRRGDVDRQPGIVVVAPRAADIGGLLEDREGD